MRKIFWTLLTLIFISCDNEPNPVKPVDKVVDFGVPHNELWYTTSDGRTINPMWAPSLEHDIVSNIYSGNKGIIQFSGDITTIGNNLFAHTYNLSTVTLPSSVTTIGNNAFENCNKLYRVDLPSTISEIGDAAFASCNLKEINIPKDVTVLNYRAFAQNSLLSDITLPNGLKKISESAFTACKSLRMVDIPDGVEEIERCAFTGCCLLEKFSGAHATEDGRALIIENKLVTFAPQGITSYEIPDNVTTIGDTAFGECGELENVIIPEGVTRIEYLAFGSCGKLQSVTIPESVTEMGGECFATYGVNLEVYCKPATPPTAIVDNKNRWNAFLSNTLTIYVPTSSVDTYKADEYWGNYKDYIVGYDF